jgi:NADH-quinone oxidoreductase subunit L
VLAYSTISQIGYMFLAVGVGAFGAGMFHLTTHAFFKALLFLGTGSVMHGLGGQTNIFKMGGLRKVMPITAYTFLIGWLAISALPPFAGFYSKDDILAAAYAQGYIGLWLVGLITAALTAFYVARIFFLAFTARARYGHGVHPHESPPSMTVPLVVLALLSVVAGLALNGGILPLGEHSLFSQFLAPVFASSPRLPEVDATLALTLSGISVAAGLLGILVAATVYVWRIVSASFLTRAFKPLYILFSHKWYVDELYHFLVVLPAIGLATLLFKIIDVVVIDGALVGGAAWFVSLWSRSLRWAQSGYVRAYAFMTLAGAVLLVIFFLFRL